MFGLPTRGQAEDPDWSYKKDLAARAAAQGGAAAAAAAASPPHSAAGEIDDDHQAEAAARMKDGDRCEAAGGRRGQIMFVGKVGPPVSAKLLCPFNADELCAMLAQRRKAEQARAPSPTSVRTRSGPNRPPPPPPLRQVPGLPAGWWAGVRFDEPVGKGNGCVNGVRYFECEEKCVPAPSASAPLRYARMGVRPKPARARTHTNTHHAPPPPHTHTHTNLTDPHPPATSGGHDPSSG